MHTHQSRALSCVCARSVRSVVLCTVKGMELISQAVFRVVFCPPPKSSLLHQENTLRMGVCSSVGTVLAHIQEALGSIASIKLGVVAHAHR